MEDRFKFRVWDKTKKNMVESNRVVIHDGDSYPRLPNAKYKDVREDFCYFHQWDDKQDVVLMQCTGLKDKNGKLIYEGDVVKEELEGECYYEVVKHDLKTASYFAGEMYLHEALEVYEVIGNIHENPELLTTKGAE